MLVFFIFVFLDGVVFWLFFSVLSFGFRLVFNFL